MLRRLLKKLTDLLMSPFVLAIIPASIIIALMPLNFQKYQVTRISDTIDISQVVFEDLNGDGDTEMLRFNYLNAGQKEFPHVVIYDVPFTNLILDQVNLDANFVHPSVPIFADIDHNGMKEVFFFLKKDSALFIAGLQFSSKSFKPELFVNKFITRVNIKDGKEDFFVFNGPAVDINGDGTDELTFIVRGLFSAEPREICIFDIKNDTIIKSPKTAIAYDMPLSVMQDTANRKFIITCPTSPTANYKGSKQKYDDWQAWAFAMDEDLKFYFPPIANQRNFTYTVQNFPFRDDRHTGIISLFNTPFGSDENEVLRKYDLRGRLLAEKKLPLTGRHYFFFVDDPAEGRFWLVSDKPKTFLLLNTDFETIAKKEPDHIISIPTINYSYFKLDADGDETDELFFTGQNNRIVIYRNDFSDPVVIPLKSNDRYVTVDRIKYHNRKQPVLYISNGDQKLMYTYRFNRKYYLKYPVWLGIYLLAVLFFRLVVWVHQRRMLKLYETEKLLYRHQLLSVKNQVDPHFTLNAINNISAMYTSGRTVEANRFLTRLSRLIHRSLMDSEQIETTVGSELRFVADYLEIQQIRFNHSFRYFIDVSDDLLSEAVIPRQVIHTFVENALKHGIRPGNNHSTIRINAGRHNGSLQITIEDDGTGRQSSPPENSTGKGLEIITKITTLYEKIKGDRFCIKLIDKHDTEGRPAGLKVVVSGPIRMK